MGEAIYHDGHRIVRRAEAKKPTAGGACAFYTVEDDEAETEIVFQYDTIPNIGVKGWTNEALLAVVLDRLEGFQAGDFPSAWNGAAIVHVKQALWELEQRTKERQERGVEGQHEA